MISRPQHLGQAQRLPDGNSEIGLLKTNDLPYVQNFDVRPSQTPSRSARTWNVGQSWETLTEKICHCVYAWKRLKKGDDANTISNFDFLAIRPSTKLRTYWHRKQGRTETIGVGHKLLSAWSYSSKPIRNKQGV